MIRPLRQRHRLMFSALSIVLPVTLIAGLASRKPAPVMGTLPPTLRDEAAGGSTVLWEREDLWPHQKLQTRLLEQRSPQNQLSVQFRSKEPILQPDLIAYWIVGTPKSEVKLPGGAILLGAFHPDISLLLPREAEKQTGALLLYSLANQEIVARSLPFLAKKN